MTETIESLQKRIREGQKAEEALYEIISKEFSNINVKQILKEVPFEDIKSIIKGKYITKKILVEVGFRVFFEEPYVMVSHFNNISTTESLLNSEDVFVESRKMRDTINKIKEISGLETDLDVNSLITRMV